MSDETPVYDGDDEWGDPGMHRPYGWTQADVDRWIEINQIAGQTWQEQFKAAEGQGFDLRGSDPRAIRAREKMAAVHKDLVDKSFTPAHIQALDANVEHGAQLELQSARIAQRRGEPLKQWQRELLEGEALRTAPAPQPPQDPALQARQQAAAKKLPRPTYKSRVMVNVTGGPDSPKPKITAMEADSDLFPVDLPDEAGQAATPSELRRRAALARSK